MKKMQRIQYVASKIKSLRKGLNWSQSKLAKEAGVTSSAISMIESGQRSPSLLVIYNICSALKVSMSELTGEPAQEQVDQHAQAFFRRFSTLEDLHESDKEKIIKIANMFKEESNNAQGSN